MSLHASAKGRAAPAPPRRLAAALSLAAVFLLFAGLTGVVAASLDLSALREPYALAFTS